MPPLATTAMVLDIRRQKQDETYPIKLRVTYQRKRKYYSTGYSYTESEFEKITGAKPREPYKDYRAELDVISVHAREVIGKMSTFSFEDFERRFSKASGSATDVFDAFKNRITVFFDNDQIGSASNYYSAMNSLKLFVKKEKLPFSSVNPSFLNSYEKWMQANEKSNTTIAIYLRPLRRLFNDAIKIGDVAQEDYPFGDNNYGKYKIPEENNFKRALSKEDIKKIFTYNPEIGSELHRCKDMWIFSYLANGLNMSDILRLKYKNIQGNTIILRRQKVRRKKSGKPIVVELTIDLKRIIDSWGQKPTKEDSYIFQILNDKMNEKRKVARIKQVTRIINRYLEKMSNELGLDAAVTTMYARHSFATMLKNAGEDISYISEAMGHSNLQTTENYLASFDENKRKSAAKKLLDF